MQEEKPTFLYRMFEDTLNFFHIKYPTAPSQTTPLTPLQKEELIFKNSLSQLKKISPKIKGTKLDYMIQRFEKEHVYLYV